MNYTWAVASHVGRVRDHNEDSAHPTAGGAGEALLAIVADGMGGAAGGEVASSTAIDAATATTLTPTERIAAANRAVHALSLAKRELAGMGTTMVVADIEASGTAHFAHVGDSRAYLLRKGSMEQLTNDHTVVAEWLALGAIDEATAKTHPRRGMLTRSVGVAAEVAIDEFETQLQPGDRLLLCSDGLNGMVTDSLIGTLLGAGSPEEAAWSLIEAANSAGGYDNITTLVVAVER